MMNQFDKANIDPEWQDLVDDFPEIFLDPSPEVLNVFAEGVVKNWGCIPQSADDLCNLRYGFECGVGWKGIIREFCEKIQALINKAKENGHEIHYKTFILKQKFGTLRDQGDFYGPDYKLYYDEYREISWEAEEKSVNVCERTGVAGKLVIEDGTYQVTAL